MKAFHIKRPGSQDSYNFHYCRAKTISKYKRSVQFSAHLFKKKKKKAVSTTITTRTVCTERCPRLTRQSLGREASRAGGAPPSPVPLPQETPQHQQEPIFPSPRVSLKTGTHFGEGPSFAFATLVHADPQPRGDRSTLDWLPWWRSTFTTRVWLWIGFAAEVQTLQIRQAGAVMKTNSCQGGVVCANVSNVFVFSCCAAANETKTVVRHDIIFKVVKATATPSAVDCCIFCENALGDASKHCDRVWVQVGKQLLQTLLLYVNSFLYRNSVSCHWHTATFWNSCQLVFINTLSIYNILLSKTDSYF